MELLQLIQAYDGCKKLGLEDATKRLERAINIYTKAVLSKVKASAIKDDSTDTPSESE